MEIIDVKNFSIKGIPGSATVGVYCKARKKFTDNLMITNVLMNHPDLIDSQPGKQFYQRLKS